MGVGFAPPARRRQLRMTSDACPNYITNGCENETRVKPPLFQELQPDWLFKRVRLSPCPSCLPPHPLLLPAKEKPSFRMTYALLSWTTAFCRSRVRCGCDFAEAQCRLPTRMRNTRPVPVTLKRCSDRGVSA